MKDAKLILVELNEINFNVVGEYINKGEFLPNFTKLMAYESRITTSEDCYSLLEPWIQWPSIHTGKTYDQHRIFRLGDAIKKRNTQIFEVLENHNFRVGAISPMNAVNVLRRPEYFIPDPWTETPSDKSLLSRMLSSALKQAVNDNSEGRLTISSLFNLGVCFFFLVRPSSYFKLLVKAFKSRGKPWRKALFLDRLLHEMHLSLLKRRDPNFSTIFFNAGAHIQHHYFLNSDSDLVKSEGNPNWYVASHEDPLREMLIEYDEILGDLLSENHWEVLVATGLTQVPVKKSIFYYRLRDHAGFLEQLNLPAVKVSPRMTRDFLVSCGSRYEAELVEAKLSEVVTRDGERVFREIDNRGNDLFVVLDYSLEITPNTEILKGNAWCRFLDDVVFVAVKNGQHDGTGFAYFSPGLEAHAPADKAHVSNLYAAICGYFGVESAV